MKSPWRSEHVPLEEAKAHNQKRLFQCSSCGEEAEAPIQTERAEKDLCKNCFGKRKDERVNQLNELSGSEWAALSKSVEQYEGTRTPKQKLHGAAFPKSLVASHIKIYTKTGDLVLDPFAGTGTTNEVAEELGRRSVGFELNPEFAALAKEDLRDESSHRIICDDCRRMPQYLEPNSVDFVFTSPPYATLLKTIKGNFGYKWREHSDLSVQANPPPYSEHASDLGNLPYSKFMEEISVVLGQCFTVLKPNTYSVWVVKDYRDLKAKTPYVNFHGDMIAAAERAGFTLWDIRIYDQTKYRPLVVLGYPSRNYYLNIGHSYILVFKKLQ